MCEEEEGHVCVRGTWFWPWSASLFSKFGSNDPRSSFFFFFSFLILMLKVKICKERVENGFGLEIVAHNTK